VSLTILGDHVAGTGLVSGSNDPIQIGPNDLIPAGLYRFHPFGLGPQGHAGHTMKICFFLHASRVGKDYSGVFFQLHHIEERNRFQKPEP